MTARMRDGFGVLCIGLICFLIGLVAGSNADPGTAERLWGVIRAAGILFIIGGLAMVAWDLLRGGERN